MLVLAYHTMAIKKKKIQEAYKEVLGSVLVQASGCRSVNVLFVTVWVFARRSSFLPPQSRNMKIRLTGDSKLPQGVRV